MDLMDPARSDGVAPAAANQRRRIVTAYISRPTPILLPIAL